MESSTEPRAANWHVVWSPVGFGNTTAKLVELWEAVKCDDSSGDTDMYFPTYMDRLRDSREIMVPLFPNYVFLRCRHHAGLEDRMRELSGIYAGFLRMPGADKPYAVTDEEMGRVREALERRIELVREWVYVEDIKIGDQVRVKSNGIVGSVLYFLPPQRAMIQAVMFNRETPVPVKIADLERI